MQPNDDLRQDDAQLREVLKEWRAPETPHSIESRVLASRRPWWRFLINGYIRVPVPLACCLAVLMLFAAWRSVRAPQAGAPCSIAEQPVKCDSGLSTPNRNVLFSAK